MTSDARAKEGSSGALWRAGVLTLSDAGSKGERADTSGEAIVELLAGAGFEVVERALLPDDPPSISARLREWADDGDLALIVTTGGTGLGPRDRTPEATAEVLDYRVDGMAEAMRAAGLASTPRAMLSRGIAGVRGRTLIVNLPGSERAVRENLGVVLPVLEHAVALVHGRTRHEARGT